MPRAGCVAPLVGGAFRGRTGLRADMALCSCLLRATSKSRCTACHPSRPRLKGRYTCPWQVASTRLQYLSADEVLATPCSAACPQVRCHGQVLAKRVLAGAQAKALVGQSGVRTPPWNLPRVSPNSTLVNTMLFSCMPAGMHMARTRQLMPRCGYAVRQGWLRLN